MTFNATGREGISYRTYRFCDNDPTPPCDEMQKNEIIDGGRVVVALDDGYRVGQAYVGVGEITASTDPTYPVGESVTGRVRGYLLTLSTLTRSG